MRLQLSTKTISQSTSDYIVLPIYEGVAFNLVKDETLSHFFKSNPKFGKRYETFTLYLKSYKLLLVGLGKKEKVDFETIQNWAGTGVKTLLSKAKEISLVLPRDSGLNAEKIGEAISIGSELASHDPSAQFKSEREKSTLSSIELLVERAEKGFQDGIKKGLIIADAINQARLLGDLPSNIMTPSYFLTEAKKIAKENKLKITIIDERRALKMGMGGFVAVAQGSDEPSYMIALEYTGNLRSKDIWAIVGKGVTFDSGGISIKMGNGMDEMKYDCAGATIALATVKAVSKLNLRVNLVAIMAMTENLPSGKALKPGDILKTYSGKTAEILNTDAEGRVLLLDAVSFAQKDFEASKVIDLATLTGAIIVALGDFVSGVFSNNDELAQKIVNLGLSIGEKFWQLPMIEDYNELIKSDIADITNIGHGGSMPGAAGAITGAKFIEAGINEKIPWVHIDIAGTAWDKKTKPYRGAGATGVGVKTLIELLSS